MPQYCPLNSSGRRRPPMAYANACYLLGPLPALKGHRPPALYSESKPSLCWIRLSSCEAVYSRTAVAHETRDLQELLAAQ